MRSKPLLLLLAGAAATAAGAPAALAQSADSLIDKLVEKGILTVDEANDLRADADKDFTKAYSVKSGMPDWVTALKFNGDFRGRFEGFYSDNPAFVDRNRWRYRLRFGTTATLLDNFEVGMRLGSGDLDSANRITAGTDPISNNQTFQNNGSKKGIFLDTAYGKWSPLNGPNLSGAFTLGKMENPFVFSDLVFDRDYTPEGGAQQFGYALSDRHALKLNLGEFILDEIGGSSDDPYLLGSQLRLESVWSPKVTTSVGASFLTILGEESLTSSAVPDINTGNLRYMTYTRDANGKATAATQGAPVYGFDTFVADAAFTYTLERFPFYNGPFPIKVFAEFLNNGAADEQNQGYQFGVTFGKAGKRKTWELTYYYKELQGDVWYEELTDSDSGAFYESALLTDTPVVARAPGTGYGAGTNLRGHVVKASFSPLDPLTLSVAFFSLDLIEPYRATTDSHMDRLQVDAILKF